MNHNRLLRNYGTTDHYRMRGNVYASNGGLQWYYRIVEHNDETNSDYGRNPACCYCSMRICSDHEGCNSLCPSNQYTSCRMMV